MRLELEISSELEQRLNAEAKARGMKLPELALETLERVAPSGTPDPDGKSCVAVAGEMWQNVPDSEWNNVPGDFAQNFRTYKKSAIKKRT